MVLTESYQISQDQMIFASFLATNAELFILAHEIAHTAIDPESLAIVPHEEEFAADALAMVIILRDGGIGSVSPCIRRS